MAGSMTRQKVWENNIQKQAIMSFITENGITDIKATTTTINNVPVTNIMVSSDKGASWKEMASVNYVTQAIAAAKPDILAGQLPQIEKCWAVNDGDRTTLFVVVSDTLPVTLTAGNCSLYDANDGTVIAVQTITKIDSHQFSVVPVDFGENINVGVNYEK